MRSTSLRERSATPSRWRRGGLGGVPVGSARRISGIVHLLRSGDQQNGVLLVDLDESHLHSLGVRGGKVLANEVGSDRQLAVPAIDEHGKLHAVGAAVVEESVDRR